MRPLLYWAGALFLATVAVAESPVSAPSMNEFSGSVITVDPEGGTLRMALDGGYNVQFTFDAKTLLMDGHDPLQASDLSYGDKVTARYTGKELYAQQIVRTSKGPASAAAPAPEPVPSNPLLSSAPGTSSVVSSVTVSTPTP